MRSMRDLIQHVRASRKGVGLRLGPAADQGSSLLARLPIELHIILLTYLNQEEVVSALDASKVLRLVWLSEDIWPWLAERLHPGLAKALRAEAGQESKTPGGGKGPSVAGTEASDLFLRRLRRLSRRTTGKYASMLHLSMELEADPVFSLSKNVPQDDGGIHSLDYLGEELEGSLRRASHPVSPFIRLMVYNNGRIAWWPESFAAPYIAVVDDLRTAKRRIYQFPNHENVQKGYKTAMSDQLLVLGRDRIIHAWHFEKDVLASVEVPELFERCITEGTVVIIIGHSSNVYKWEFAKTLITLNTLGCYQPGPIRVGAWLDHSPLQALNPPLHIPRRQGLVFKETGMHLDFIPHPYLTQVIFVVTMQYGRLMVHETDHGRLVKTHRLHSETTLLTQPWLAHRHINEYLRWEKCDSYGGYRLFSEYLDADDDGVSPGVSPASLPCPEEPCCICDQMEGLVSICFNIYTKQFKVQCHHPMRRHVFYTASIRERLTFRPAAFYLWDSKLYMTYDAESMESGMPMAALLCCREIEEASCDTVTRTPIYRSFSSSPDILARRHTIFPERILESTDFLDSAFWKSQAAFGLDVTSRAAADSVSHRSSASLIHIPTSLWKWTGHHINQTIVGDDDFLVYVVDGVYMVWSFGDEILAPRNRRTKWAPWRRTTSQARKT